MGAGYVGGIDGEALVLAVACASVALTVVPSRAGDACGPGQMRSFGVRSGALFLRWEGTIDAKMVADIAAEFDRYKRTAKTVTISLSSCGGSTHHMHMAINLLNYIKATHPLTTMVERGGNCGSACVAVFLAGSRRVGALASLWFFHPARRQSTARGGARRRATAAGGHRRLHHALLCAGRRLT